MIIDIFKSFTEQSITLFDLHKILSKNYNFNNQYKWNSNLIAEAC